MLDAVTYASLVLLYARCGNQTLLSSGRGGQVAERSEEHDRFMGDMHSRFSSLRRNHLARVSRSHP